MGTICSSKQKKLQKKPTIRVQVTNENYDNMKRTRSY